MNKIFFVFRYMLYLLTARSKYSIHSPFVYDFYTHIILNKKKEDVYKMIEHKRADLLKQKSLLETTDFGSGASGNGYSTKYRQVRSVTRNSSISPKFGKLLHRVVKHQGPGEVLEMGTAMGISTLYIATAAPESRIVTLEGCAVIAEKAEGNFRQFSTDNIELATGHFDHVIDNVLSSFDHLDFVFIDGNHRKEPTIDYFNKILPKLHAGSILVIDDIHRSGGMEKAWKAIQAEKKVSITIDLFRLGIVLFKADIAKEDFVLRF